MESDSVKTALVVLETLSLVDVGSLGKSCDAATVEFLEVMTNDEAADGDAFSLPSFLGASNNTFPPLFVAVVAESRDGTNA